MHVRAGYFINEDLGNFDAAFFNLSAETAAVRNTGDELEMGID